MVRENLSAPGKLADWIDASDIALDSGDFTKIKLSRHGNIMTAEYGADTISIEFGKKDQQHVLLKIECDDEQVLNWYKTCVTDVIRHPQKYAGYYDDEEEDVPQALPEVQRKVPEPPVTPAEPAYDEEGSYGDPRGGEVASEPQNTKGKLQSLLSATWFTIVMLVVLPPFGIYLLFRNKVFGLGARVGITLVTLFYTLFIWLGLFGINTGFNSQTIGNWIGCIKGNLTQTETVVNQTTPTALPDTEE